MFMARGQRSGLLGEKRNRPERVSISRLAEPLTLKIHGRKERKKALREQGVGRRQLLSGARVQVRMGI